MFINNSIFYRIIFKVIFRMVRNEYKSKKSKPLTIPKELKTIVFCLTLSYVKTNKKFFSKESSKTFQ